MSWSVNAFGKPAAVKTALAKQFESAKLGTKSLPHEHAAVESIENIVNWELDFLAACTNKAGYAYVVRVEAGGSAYKSADGSGYTQINCKVQPELISE